VVHEKKKEKKSEEKEKKEKKTTFQVSRALTHHGGDGNLQRQATTMVRHAAVCRGSKARSRFLFVGCSHPLCSSLPMRHPRFADVLQSSEQGAISCGEANHAADKTR
jgi:hypothetical protein